jgi:hypothetical protein
LANTITDAMAAGPFLDNHLVYLREMFKKAREGNWERLR